MFYLVLDQSHIGTPHQFCEPGELMVHLFELRTNGEYQFYTLLLGHLLVNAYLPNGVDDAYALVDDADIDVIAFIVQCHCNALVGVCPI